MFLNHSNNSKAFQTCRTKIIPCVCNEILHVLGIHWQSVEDDVHWIHKTKGSTVYVTELWRWMPKFWHLGFDALWLEKQYRLVVEDDDDLKNSPLIGERVVTVGLQAPRGSLEIGQWISLLRCWLPSHWRWIWERKDAFRRLEDLGCTNNYIKHDTTELFLYYTLSSHCNIHIDHLWHSFNNFEYIFMVY